MWFFRHFFAPYLFHRSRNNRRDKLRSKFWREKMFRKPHLKLLRWFSVYGTNKQGHIVTPEIHAEIKGGSCQNLCVATTFLYIWPQPESHRSEGVKVYILQRSRIQKLAPYEVQEKLLQQKPKIFGNASASAWDAGLPTSLRGFASDLIWGNIIVTASKLVDRFLLSVPVQKISLVEVEIPNERDIVNFREALSHISWNFYHHDSFMCKI